MPSPRLALIVATGLVLLASVAGGAAGCGFDGTGTSADASDATPSVPAGPEIGDSGLLSDGDALATPDALFVDANGAPELTVTSGVPPAQVDLEAEGTLGWIHWGTEEDDENSLNQKAAAVGSLPTYSVTGSTDVRTFEDNFTTFRWTNGTPMGTQTATRNGVYSKTGKPQFHLKRAVGVDPQRFVIYAGVYECKALLTVVLGTGVGAHIATITLDDPGHAYGRFVIDHRAKDPATPLDVTWELVESYDPNNANITLAAATLAPLL